MPYPRLSDVVNILVNKEMLAAAQDESTRAPKIVRQEGKSKVAQSAIKVPGDKETADNHYQMAEKAFEKRELLVALQEAVAASKLNPDHPDAQSLASDIRRQLGEISFNPEAAADHYIAALRFYTSGDFFNADREIRQALASNSDWESAKRIFAEVRQPEKVIETVAAPKIEPKQEVVKAKPEKIDKVAKCASDLENAKNELRDAPARLERLKKEKGESEIELEKLQQKSPDSYNKNVKKCQEKIEELTKSIEAQEKSIDESSDAAAKLEQLKQKKAYQEKELEKLKIKSAENNKIAIKRLQDNIKKLAKSIDDHGKYCAKLKNAISEYEKLLKDTTGFADEVEKRKTETFAKLGINSKEFSEKAKLVDFLRNNQNTQVGKLLFGDRFEVRTADSLFNGKLIIENFEKLNQKYRYFDEQDEKSQGIYLQFYQACYYNWTIIEDNANPEEIYEYAYKYMAVFLNYQKEKGLEGNLNQLCATVDKFIGENSGNINKPLHDLMSAVSLPVYKGEGAAPNFDLPAWQKLIRENGPTVLKHFGHAARINPAPKDLKELNEKVAHLSYPRAKEDPGLAALFSKYKVVETRFNRTLDLIKAGTLKVKESDHLPSVVIDVAKEVEGAESRKNYYLMRLPAGDPRGFILGDITNCCQSIDGHSEKCAIDGSSRDNNGFYVLIKTNKPIDEKTLREYENNPAKQREFWKGFEERGNEIFGQGYVWRSKAGNIVIDSWENLTPTRDDQWMKPILETFSKKLMAKDKSISRVTIGTGGKTPDALKESTVVEADLMHEGHQYGDSYNQAVIIESQKLIKARKAFAAKLKDLRVKDIPPLSHCISIEQIAMLNGLNDKLLHTIVNHKEFAKIISYSFMPYNLEEAEAQYNGLLLVSKKEPEKFELLLSAITKGIYQAGGARVSDLTMLDNKKIKLLIKNGALELYKTGGAILTDIAKLDNEKIKLLISPLATAAYSTGMIKASDLIKLDNEVIKLLTSKSALDLYNREIKPGDIIGAASSWIEIRGNLLKLWAQTLYKEEIADTLIPQDESKFSLLVSELAKEAYGSGMVKVSDLISLESVEIEILISEGAVSLYQKGIDISNIIGSNSSLFQIKINLLKLLAKTHCGEGLVDSLIPEEEYIIDLLISYEAALAYKTGGVKVSDLASLDYEEIKIMISYEAREAYKTGMVKASDLIDLDDEQVTEIFDTAKKAGKLDEALSFDNSDIDLSALKQLNKCISYFDTSKLSDQFLEDLHKKSSTILSQPKTSETANEYNKAEEVEQIYAKILKQRELGKTKAPSSSQVSR
jgi:hypothetical protein